MKELLYRLPSSRWFARLFSILAFAALGLYYPSKSFATVYCKDNSPLTPCTRFSGTTCPPLTKPLYTTKCSTTGGTTGTGSEWTAFVKIGDQGVALLKEDFTLSNGVCGPGFMDIMEDTLAGSAVQCEYTADSGPNEGVSKEARCFFKDLVCPCNKIAACIGGQRESFAICPTIVDGENVAGCTGELTVLDLDGNTIRGPGGSDGGTIQIGDGRELLTTVGKCQKVYPETDEFAKLVASKIVQQCGPNDDGSNLAIVEKNPIVEYAARSTNNYEAKAEYSNLGGATCNPLDGYPPGSCANDSGANITFSADAMFGDLIVGPQPKKFPSTGDTACLAENFRCGQLLDLTSGDLTFGPQPSKCTLDKKSGNTLCSCRCDRCTPEGTLVNSGTGDQGLFVLSSAISADAVSCSVRVTGN
jgi:hypothetical protein